MEHLLRDQPRRTDDGRADATPDTTTLVARSKQGEPEAFALLYRRYVAAVYDYARRRLPDPHLAEEATQEIFYRSFRELGRCRDDAAFAGWLFGIARFVVVDVQRSHRDVAWRLEDAPDLADADPIPEEHVLGTERREELLAARERCLSRSDRELFDLLLADLTDQEIATALGRRSGAIRTAHWRLLGRLRDCFGVSSTAKGVRHVAS